MVKKHTHFLAKFFVGMMLVLMTLFVGSNAAMVFAADSGPENGDAGGFVPCGNESTNPCTVDHLFSAFVVIINYLISMAGFIAVVAIVFAGFQMVYSQGQDQLKSAKGRLSGAVIGLVLVAAAYIIVNAIFAGSVSLGVRQGADVLANPFNYIKNGPTGAGTGK
jgi:amino acid transporter